MIKENKLSITAKVRALLIMGLCVNTAGRSCIGLLITVFRTTRTTPLTFHSLVNTTGSKSGPIEGGLFRACEME